MNVADKEEEIRTYYRALRDAWGRQHWWPARTRFEVIVGAYLTQNTAWTNVEKALANLRAARRLSISGIRQIKQQELECLIRPSGYFRQKAKALKTFIEFLDNMYGSSLVKLLAEPTQKLREELLSLNGVGPETADSILLYAGNHSVLVVDAYTRRILNRHAILPGESKYEDIRRLFEKALPPIADEESPLDIQTRVGGGPAGSSHHPSPMSTLSRPLLAQVYNEMHGLIVGVGKNYCRKSEARCDGCPLQKYLPGA